MPAFAFVVVLLAFCGLALLADRIWPRAEPVREEKAAVAPARHSRVA
jgi:hypothetical protein